MLTRAPQGEGTRPPLGATVRRAQAQRTCHRCLPARRLAERVVSPPPKVLGRSPVEPHPDWLRPSARECPYRRVLCARTAKVQLWERSYSMRIGVQQPTPGELEGEPMTERERRTRSGGTEDNVRDELDEAAERGKPGKDASKEAVEEEERTGGVKDNVEDEWDESQER